MNFTNFLPVEDYTLRTQLSVGDVIARIKDNTRLNENLGLFTKNNDSSGTKTYEGFTKANSFTISRIINYRNSFLPIITGSISSFTGHIEIKIRMRLQKFVMIFIAIFMAILGIAFVYFVVNLHGTSYFFVLNTFISLIFCGLLTYFAFKKESKISKQFLARLLEAEESRVHK